MTNIEQEYQNGHTAASEPMPVLFVGHGSPMNAIEDNAFTKGWQNAAKTLPRPKAVLCISAHWETRGTFVTAVEKPRTIHDFYGFPDPLFQVQYPAPGSPEVARETASTGKAGVISPDYAWGLDHGSWSVIRHFYPDADIPVLQLSLDYSLSPAGHFDLARQLAGLRRNGVLIVGSGNIVHNLRMISWKEPNSGFPWAEEAEAKFKKLILDRNYKDLFDYQSLGREVQLSVPTPEHFLPLLYILALQEKDETVTFFNDQRVYGSLSMTSILINRKSKS